MAVIVPTPQIPSHIHAVLGRATADYPARQPGESRVRAVGRWGATLRENSSLLATPRRPELSINSLMGGPDLRSELNTFKKRSPASCSPLMPHGNNLAAHYLCGQPEVARATHPGAGRVFRETFQRLPPTTWRSSVADPRSARS